ncbi:MAG TPA: hypothetical protein VMM77_02355 [Gemmatimonadaceae bacterium]|nr:hypothetical protein [Gemmatimonadaceae bacterium]
MRTAALFFIMLLVAPPRSAGAQLSREAHAALHSDLPGRSGGGTRCPCSSRATDYNQMSFHMPAIQAEHDPWFGTDKVRHFFVSAMLQSVGYGTLRALDVRHGSALAGASVVTAGFGIGKELSDRRQGREVSMRDLIWNAAGAGAATLLLVRTER